jgi:glycosyltransferase involved in cell wall biosynthesis
LERLRGGRILARRLDRRLEGITFVSANLQARFEALLGTPAQCRVRVIPMGISPTQGRAAYETQLRTQAKNRRIVATVGRLAPIKGLDDLAHALVDVEDVVWFCAGDGPEKERLRALCRRLGVPRIALGRVGPAERDALLAVADVFVLPSRPIGHRTEGTPISLLEALAAGTPCVATETGGIGPVAEAAEAILVPPGDLDALKSAVHTVLSAPERRRSMSEAHRRVGSRYRWDVIGAQHADAFAQSLND